MNLWPQAWSRWKTLVGFMNKEPFVLLCHTLLPFGAFVYAHHWQFIHILAMSSLNSAPESCCRLHKDSTHCFNSWELHKEWQSLSQRKYRGRAQGGLEEEWVCTWKREILKEEGSRDSTMPIVLVSGRIPSTHIKKSRIEHCTSVITALERQTGGSPRLVGQLVQSNWWVYRFSKRFFQTYGWQK